jgi:hypothetical protein
MRSIAEYLGKAAEFDVLAKSTDNPTLKKRYSDVAECYRLLASDLRRLIATGARKSDEP